MKKKINDLVISTSEPSTDVMWLKPLHGGVYSLLIFSSNGWSPVITDLTGKFDLLSIQEIPDIITNKE